MAEVLNAEDYLEAQRIRDASSGFVEQGMRYIRQLEDFVDTNLDAGRNRERGRSTSAVLRAGMPQGTPTHHCEVCHGHPDEI